MKDQDLEIAKLSIIASYSEFGTNLRAAFEAHPELEVQRLHDIMTDILSIIAEDLSKAEPEVRKRLKFKDFQPSTDLPDKVLTYQGNPTH